MLKPSTRFLLAVWLWGVLLPALVVPQTPEPLGDDYRLNETGSWDFRPDIGMDARGNFVIVWGDGFFNGYETFWDLSVRRFSSTGTPLTGDIRVNQERRGADTGPDLAVAPDGKFVVAWLKTPVFQTASDLWGRQFTSAGFPSGDEFLIAAATGGYDLGSVDVDMSSKGESVVVWRRFDEDQATIQARRFSSTAEPLGGEFLVNPDDTERAAFPVVHWTPNGGFIVVWGTIEGGSGRRFSAEGSPVGLPFAFHDMYARGIVNALDVSPTGEFVVAWMEFTDSSYDDTDIFARRFAADTTPLSDRFQVNTTTIDIQEWPSVAMERGGEFVVVWDSYHSTGTDDWGESIQAQRFSSTGGKVGSEFQVNTTTAYSQYFPSVVAQSGKGFVVAWSSYEGYSSFIRGRRFGPTPPFCNESETVACLNSGRFHVEVEWTNFVGKTGPGRRVAQGSDDSALFWFFGPDNWEVLVKVLDGCAINHRFWVFAATTTNVAYVLRITDTETGQVREYENPLGKAADAVTDTEAFATC